MVGLFIEIMHSGISCTQQIGKGLNIIKIGLRCIYIYGMDTWKSVLKSALVDFYFVVVEELIFDLQN